jgi:dienelactone hydrolase
VSPLSRRRPLQASFALGLLVIAGLAACGTANDGPAEPTVDAGGADAALDGAARDGAIDSGSDRSDAGPGDAQADGTTDAGPPGPPIFLCGGAPYQWLPASQVGTVVERKSVTRHTQFDLTLILAKLRSDGTFKTSRLPKHDVKVDVIRYNTQDRGTLAEATGAVAYPTNRNGDTPVMLLLHGTAGFSDGCAPTRTAAGTTNPVDAFTQDLPTLLSLFASFGYIVVAPDYLGLKGFGPPSTTAVHPYLVGEPTAIASLDMVRAAKAMLAGESAVPGKLVVVGGSQGGHAAAFVDRLGPHYAPELPIAGAVWDVPPTDLAAHAKHALDADGPATDNIAYFLMASNYWYSRNLQGPDQAFLPPYNRSLTAALPTDCKLELLDNATRDQVFTPGVIAARTSDFAGVAPIDCYVRENTLARTSIPKVATAPTLFLTAENDTLVLTSIERNAFTQLCNQGYSLQYLECAGATHTKPLSFALDTWFDFLSDRLAGKPMPATTCALKPAERCVNTP